MAFESHHLIYYAVIGQIDNRLLFDGEQSEWGAVSIGIPWGYILGPLLFPLYINDLPSVVTHSYLDLYADDTELYCSDSDLCIVETCLQSDLDAVVTWLQSSCLCLNVGKSSCMLIKVIKE